jgi:sulfonate transport system ATP-binding protein
VVPVDLPHPRERTSFAFAAAKEAVMHEFAGHPAAELAEPPLKRSEPLAPASQWQFAV